MGVFFGTDGLRGRVNDDLSFDIAYNYCKMNMIVLVDMNLKPNTT